MGYAAFLLLWEQVNKMQSKVFDKQSKMSIIVVCEVKHDDTWFIYPATGIKSK